jgi:hypothetical protein
MSMIRMCRHCQKHYWRYRRDHPPAFFCSVPCADAGPSTGEPAPPAPSAALATLRQHLRIMHSIASSDYGLSECGRCEELEEQYAISLQWHAQHVTAEPTGRPPSRSFGSSEVWQ